MKDKQRSKFKIYKNLYSSLYPQLSGVAYQYIKDFKESQEIVQEVFLDAWADYSELDNENEIIFLFYDTVVNKCVDILKEKQVHNSSPSQ